MPEQVISIVKAHEIHAALAALRQKRDAMLPLAIQCRIDERKTLPDVVVHTNLTREREEEETGAVLRYVIQDMKQALVVDLAKYITPKWAV